MAVEIRELVQEIAELRLLIAAWSGHKDPQLLEVVEQMRTRVDRQLERLQRMLHAQQCSSQQLH